jgi:hypothetical protein
LLVEDDEARRLRALVESSTAAAQELRSFHDPAVARLIEDLERVRAESVARLAEVGAGERDD